MIKTKYWIGLFLLLLALSALAAALLLRDGHGNGTAVVLSEGEEVCTVDLSRDQTFTVEATGGANVIVVEDGAIRVESATCPDQICVRRAPARRARPLCACPTV